MRSHKPIFTRPDRRVMSDKSQPHIPQRMCMICRTRLSKNNLYRYVCQRNGHGRPALLFDPHQILPGRGFYVCSDPECQRALVRHKGWQKKCRGES
ncbi:MAG: DUF448 domain-containing protein [Desulfovermiculus sp.]|nr:DUF448 domain-containing protein [Desulfovermiculus sp.]